MASEDWVTKLADAIQDRGGIDSSREAARGWVSAIIEEFSPFKRDVAYMPVPRCETCGRWDRNNALSEQGQCLLMYESDPPMWPDYRDGIMTKADFGCKEWKEK